MLKIALIYGAIAGSITIASMTLGIVLSGGEGWGASAILGYLIMLVALSMIFVAVKRHRDRDLGGVIKFGPAFGLGIAIAAVAGIFYVAGWETYLNISDYAFMEEYTKGIIASKEAAGVAGAELEKLIADMNAMKEQYKNPLYRLPVTFIEIFPVGLAVALVSAAILRNPKFLPARG